MANGRGNISGATNSIYKISSVSSQNSGNYECIIKNTCETVTGNPITLTAVTPVSASFITANKTKCTGDSSLIKVTATGNPISYQWYLNNKAISCATANNYLLSTINSSEAGTYSCIISNSCNNVTLSSILIVNLAPVVNNTIPPQSVCQGQSATFTVDASGTNLSYQWTIEGGRISGATNSVYTISQATVADYDVYSCTVSNTCGTANLNQFILTVNTPPSSNTVLINDTRYLDDTVSFNISPGGTKPLSYQWRIK